MTITDHASTGTPPSSGTPAARAIDLAKIYGKGDAAVHALAGVNVEFRRGQFTAVMGPSGSGKSTLMHCMAGLDTPTSGHAYVGDQDIGLLDDAGLTQMRRDRVGFVFQSFNLVPTLTARENITLPSDLAGKKVDQAWFDYLVGQLGIGDRLSHRPQELSGGQQQRAACAAGADRTARPDLRRRAHRQPRLELLRGDARLPASVGEGIQPVDRHGHPRSPRCRLRRPGRVPRRRPGRGRAVLTYRRLGAGAHEAAGELTCGRSRSRACSPTNCGWC